MTDIQIKTATKRCRLNCEFSAECLKDMEEYVTGAVTFIKGKTNNRGIITQKDKIHFGQASLNNSCSKGIWHSTKWKNPNEIKVKQPPEPVEYYHK